MSVELTSTKEIIFDTAIRLFAFKGYENTGIREIAEKAGITTASIYYHFLTKNDILDCVYEYYSDHLFDNAIPIHERKASINTDMALEIIERSAWTFYGMPPQVHERMTIITKIIYMRFLQDPKANSIFRDYLVKKNLSDGLELLGYGISIGKIKPDTDLMALCEMILYIRLMTGVVGLADNYAGGIVDKKEYLNIMLSKLLESFINGDK